ncbi:MAG: hypothetical protein WCV71_03595 [Patescibacteria group bacterium]|jgi:uncharacterized protein (DUF3084 family)
MLKKKSNVSNQKILQAVQGLDKTVQVLDKKLQDLDVKVSQNTTNIDKLASAINDFANHTEERFDKIDQRFDKIESTMVTKDYLDDKLSDLKIDMLGTVDKKDKKVNTLIKVLDNKKIINKKEVKLIMTA